MKIIVISFGFAVTLVGLAGVIAPQQFRRVLGKWSGQKRFLFAVVVRLVFGALLLSELVALRFPAVMKIIGGISFLAGVVLLLLGQDRLDRLVAWWLRQPDTLLRISTGLATVFGLFLIYVAL